jgi:hypothetical protein
MVLTNAERQRKWREKRKTENLDGFLATERERKRKAYVSVAELNERELKKRRKDGRERERKSYYNRKQKKAEKTENSNSDKLIKQRRTRKDGPIAASTPLVVKLPAVKKRYSRALRTAYRDIERLKEKNKELERGKKKLQKRCERFAATCSSDDMVYSADISCETSETETHLTPSQPLTPRSKSFRELRSEGLSPRKCKGIRKKLIMANSLIEAIQPVVRVKKNSNGNGLERIRRDILKKYRCGVHLSKSLGVSRKKIRSMGTKRKSNTKQQLQATVTTFLEREDNCTTLPGKRDVKESKQKVVLSDYMHNLHEKFQIENPTIKISRSCFCKMRPTHVLLASFSSRRTCLCSIHQNMALKLKSISCHVACSKNPDNFIKQFESDENLQDELNEKLGDEVVFKQWKKVNDGDKYRWKEVEVKMPKDEFVDHLLKELKTFRCHVERVQTQYREIRRLRENLPDGEVLLWMDFAENYTCASMEEVQSAYWNASMVSLHTMVAYFPGDGTQRSLQSYVAVSDVLSHNATAVFTILKKVLPMIKEEYPLIRKVHYLTDSPTSQYRNKTIFQLLVDHEAEFGIKAQWNYLESGHGKGPCDGLGASVKRAADMAIKQGKASIQNGKDFYHWATTERGSKVKYVYYGQEDYDEAKIILDSKEKCIPVSGTFKLHAVVPIDSVRIAVRDTSCYCPACTTDVLKGCVGWKVNQLLANSPEINEQHTEQNEDHLPEIGVFVAAVYSGQWYIGKVTENDEEDKEVQVNFMVKAGKYGANYKWPTDKDEIWIHVTHILMEISPPKAAGKTSRFFRIDKEVEKIINEKFQKYSTPIQP